MIRLNRLLHNITLRRRKQMAAYKATCQRYIVQSAFGGLVADFPDQTVPRETAFLFS